MLSGVALLARNWWALHGREWLTVGVQLEWLFAPTTAIGARRATAIAIAAAFQGRKRGAGDPRGAPRVVSRACMAEV